MMPDAVIVETANKDFPFGRIAFRSLRAPPSKVPWLKDPASTDVTRGCCRVIGLAAISLLLDCAEVVR